MRGITTVIMAFAATAVGAQDWELQDDAGIMSALVGKTIQYDAYTVQSFAATGDTQFVTERAADGRWAARGDQYCSTWPPSDTWECYDLYVAGDAVRFVASDRSESIGTIVE